MSRRRSAARARSGAAPAAGLAAISAGDTHDVDLAAAASLLAPLAVGKSFAREIASEEKTTGSYAWRRFTLEGDPHPSRILAEKSEPTDRLGELYDRMLATDLDLSGFVQKRKDAVLKLPRSIVAADGTPRAAETATFCHSALSIVRDLATNLQHQLDSRAKGIAIEELLWERIPRGELAGAWVPVGIVDRPMWRFLFREGQLFVRQAHGKEAIEAPLGKFLVMTHGTKDSPWGAALLDDCWRAWWLKKNGLKFWAIFLDKWGQPTAIGKYKAKGHGEGAERTNQKNQALLLEVIEKLQSSYGIALPDGLELELLEASRSGSVSYEAFQGMLTRSMAIKILGEVDTSGVAKGPGSFAKADISNEVRLEKVVLDARDLAAHLKDDLLSLLVAVNFGPDWPVPLWQIDTVEAEDRELRQDGIDKVLGAGEPVGRRYFYLTHQVPEPAPGEAVVRREKSAASPPPAPPSPNAPPGEPEGNAGPEPPSPRAAAAAARARRARGAAEHRLDAAAADADRARVEARDADFATVAEAFVPRTLDYYADWRERLLAAWDSGDVEGGTALRRLVGEINPLEQARAIETAQIHGAGLALLHLSEDVGARAIRAALPPAWTPGQTPSSALEYWAQLLQLPKSAFLGLEDSMRRMAFAVAGVEDITLVVEMHALIGEASAGGWVRETFVDQLDALFERRGLTPLRRWHAELIFSNNVRNAAHLLRYQHLVLNPAAKRLTPYLRWVFIEDGRGRPEHELMSGHVAAIDHEIWKTWWPLAGHGCRCGIATINLAEARRLGYTGAEPLGPWPLFEGARVMPDEGFRGAPDLGALGAHLEARAGELLGDAGRSGNEDLAEALRQLFAQLFGVSPEGFAFSRFLRTEVAA
jgi:phage gp29-like protein